MSFNAGKKRSGEAWAVVDNEGLIAWTTGSLRGSPKLMVYADGFTACRNLRHAPRVEGREYSVARIYLAKNEEGCHTP